MQIGFVASKNTAVFPESLQPDNQPKPGQQPSDDQNFPEPEDYSDAIRPLLSTYAEVSGTQPSPSQCVPCSFTRKSTTSHTSLPDNVAPHSSGTRSKSITQNVEAPTAKPALNFLQITSDPLAFFQSEK
jgi:hypothetical protein